MENKREEPFTPEEIRRHWDDTHWSGWHSAEYLEKRRNNEPVVYDDKYIRKYLLLPLTNEAKAKGTLLNELPIRLVIEHLHDEDPSWWQTYLPSVILLTEWAYLKNGIELGKSIYKTWLTRITQFILTEQAESAISERFRYDRPNGEVVLHLGAPTAEAKPDLFDRAFNRSIELKVVSGFGGAIDYVDRLRNNYLYQRRNAFHGADYAMFCMKATTEERKSKIWTLDLSNPCPTAMDLRPAKGEFDLGLLPVDPMRPTHLAKEELPKAKIIPAPFLYGLSLPGRNI